MAKILIVEDDYDIAQLEKDYLNLNGHEVVVALDGEEGLKLALSAEFQLIMLDVMLPKLSGLEICSKIRDIINCPIIMVSAKTEDIDEIRALGLGADDYIEKPFSPSVLVAKVNAHLKQMKRLNKDEKLYCFDNIKINLKSRQVFKNDKEIVLKNKEYELLSFLIINNNTVYTKEDLYQKIWGQDALGDNATITVHINRLREKIEDVPSNPKHLCTVWGVGYCFK